MPRARDDMQVNVAGLRRNIKNLAHNYSDAQVKVREATSNDPWGPSSTLMAEIADLTYNVMAFTEIMQMIWKRLNDHGKNWRHVYKALVLMEYLIKTGTEKVAQQCKENIYAIETLKDFQYLEEGKDQGLNVREKAKQLVILLKDEERLRNERARALKAKERFAQTASAFGSDGALDSPASPSYPTFGGSADWSRTDSGSGAPGSVPAGATAAALEAAFPHTAGEEELQLQLALAMSREEADRDERQRRSDNVRLQLAISQSQHDFQRCGVDYWGPKNEDITENVEEESENRAGSPDPFDYSHNDHSISGCWLDETQAHASTEKYCAVDEKPSPPQPQSLLDLLDVNLGAPGPGTSASGLAMDPWGLPPSPPQRPQQQSAADPWGGVPPPVVAADPWAAPQQPLADPWAPTTATKSPVNILSSPASDLEEFDAITNRSRTNGSSDLHANNGHSALSPDPFDLNILGERLSESSPKVHMDTQKKTPLAFLGENSSLVNLDNLVKPTNGLGPSAFNPANPFAEAVPSKPNLFQQTPQPRLTINELKQQAGMSVGSSSLGIGSSAGIGMGMGAGMGSSASDPWAPVRTASPWSPQHPNSNTPNPFLS